MCQVSLYRLFKPPKTHPYMFPNATVYVHQRIRICFAGSA